MSLAASAARAFTRAHSQLASGTLTIAGGPAINAVPNSATFARDYDPAVYELSERLELVVAADWTASYPLGTKAYVGNLAAWAGQDWRVKAIRAGDFFTVLELGEESAGA